MKPIRVLVAKVGLDGHDRGAKIIATGGNSKLVKKYARSIQVVDEDLTLKGLNLIGLGYAD